MINLDPSHECADHVAPPVPVQLVQAGAYPPRKFGQPSDHQLEATLGFVRRRGDIPVCLQSGQTLLETSQTRLELVRFDDLLGVAVDQAVNPAT